MDRRRQELQSILAGTRKGFAKRRRTRRVRLAFAGLSLLAALALIVHLVPILTTGLATASSEIDRLAKPFENAGFAAKLTAWGPNPTEVDAQPGTCFVAVAASGDGAARVRLERGYAMAESATSLGWCTCGAEKPRVSAVGSEPLVLRLLSAPAQAVGGADLLGQLEPRPETVVPETVDRACAEQAIDAWLAGRGAAQPPRALTMLEEKLRGLGLRPVAHAPSWQRFCTVPPVMEGCFLATSREPTDALSLRIPGGRRPLVDVRSALGFCTRNARSTSIWRTGRGDLTVFAVPAQRVGGLVGLRDLGARAGIPVATWVAPEDQIFEATSTLLASGVSPSLLVEDPAASLSQAAILGLSTAKTSTFSIEPGDSTILCRPEVTVGAVQALCVAASPDAWKSISRLPEGAVAARRPSWFPTSGASDPALLERLLDVLAFGRRMALAGFELSLTGGVTPTAAGARITGRSGEKEIVAIALDPAEPYVHTLSDGDTWSLDEPPRIVPVSPGQTKDLTASPKYRPGAKHEILVWRR